MNWIESWLKIWLAFGFPLGLAIVTMSNPESSSVDELPNSLHVTAGNTSVKEDENVDPNGYILFCPCMGK